MEFLLNEIAGWKGRSSTGTLSSSIVEIPALQRGLVWKPQQNELLWDSILRGFPVGALVVVPWSQRLKRVADTCETRGRYHLLDGQQRCHAIALGFDDPFAERVGSEEIGAILWLDLEPEPAPHSTRKFWVRATTTAHPWGYSRNDNSTCLSAWQMRSALESAGLDPKDPACHRPKPVDLWPSTECARTPVPLGWLLACANDCEEPDFWRILGEKASKHARRLKWADSVAGFCARAQTVAHAAGVFSALRRVAKAKLIAVEAPSDLLETSTQELANDPERDGVSNIEQIFQRLNQQGTRLDGEELAYSMIKAYWPEVEPEIDLASEHRMPPARMVTLAVRTALADPSKETLPSQPTVSGLRVIARIDGEKRRLVEDFVRRDLQEVCARVDQWLRYDRETCRDGLLPVLRTSIAINSREVYLLLLHFAHRSLQGEPVPEDWPRTMLAMATAIHWFATDKGRVVNAVFSASRSAMEIDRIAEALQSSIRESALHPIHPPGDPDAFLAVEENQLRPVTVADFIGGIPDDPGEWRWWKLIHRENDETGNARRVRGWEGFLQFRSNPELLIHAQRSFVGERFSDYNPQRRDLWEDHNRPWDFDHILASKFVSNRKRGIPFQTFCHEWLGTIGNLRAWPMTDNRSDQAETAFEKLGSNPDLLADSFVDRCEISGFSDGWDSCANPTSALEFAKCCRRRLIRIYREWYDSTDIVALIPHGSWTDRAFEDSLNFDEDRRESFPKEVDLVDEIASQKD